jgi:hypothetical protein
VTVATPDNGSATVKAENSKQGSTKISVSGGTKVIVTPTPAATYMVGSITAKDAKNNNVAVSYENGTYSLIMPKSNVTVTATFVKDPNADQNNDPSKAQETIRNYSKDYADCEDQNFVNCPMKKFDDTKIITDTTWYHDGVHYCLENGIMKGYPDDRFRPEAITTRAQLVQVLYNIAGEPNVISDKHYNDVSRSDWFYAPIQWATKNEIVSGYTNGNFGPNDPITREQVVRILMGFAKFLGYDTSATSDLKGYTDTNTVSSWATEYVQWAVGAGVYCGPNGSKTLLAANGNAVRDELATMMMNFCTKLAK